LKDELIGRFVFVGTQPGTVMEIIPAIPATSKKVAVPETIKVKLHNVPNKMRSENVVVEVDRHSKEWRLKYPDR
jgi:hypothetical protein